MMVVFVAHSGICRLAQPIWMRTQSGALSTNIPATRAARNLDLQVSTCVLSLSLLLTHSDGVSELLN